MSDLETRLHTLRETPVPTGPGPAAVRDHARRRRRHRRVGAGVGLGALCLLVVVSAGLVLRGGSPAEEVVVGSPDPPEADAEPGATGPMRTIGGVEGVVMEVTPREGLVDGQVVEVRVEGLEALPDAVLALCAGDVTQADAMASCQVGFEDPDRQDDPAGVGSTRVSAARAHQRVRVPRVIFVGRGSGDPNAPAAYDCATEPAGCVLAVGTTGLDGPARGVVVPLTFEFAPLEQPTIALEPSEGLRDGEEVRVTGEGFWPDSPVPIALCEVATPPGPFCDQLSGYQVVTADGAGRIAATVRVSAAIYTFFGRIDCTVATCAVVVGEYWEDRAAIVPYRLAGDVVAPVPRLTVEPSGPYVDAQEVTLLGEGFPRGFDVASSIGQCPAHLDTSVEERCSYPSAFGSRIVADDGTFELQVRLVESLVWTGTCVGQPGCVLAWVLTNGPIAASVPLDFGS